MQDHKDFDNSLNSTQPSLISQSSSTSLQAHHFLKCISNKVSADMCLNEKCKQQNLFQCLDQNCQCRFNHDKCKNGRIKSIVNMLNSKIFNPQPLHQELTTMIDKKIDQLSQLDDLLMKEFNHKFKYIEFHDLQMKFLSLMKGEAQLNQLSSFQSKEIWQEAIQEGQVKKYNLSQKLKSHINQLSQEISKSISEFIKNLHTVLSQINQDKIKQLQKRKQHKMRGENLSLFKELLKTSAICTNEQLSKQLLKMFNKKISKLEHLFSASKNEFSIAKYFEACGKIPNTVVICKTNNDKIIGGFTPLVHDDHNSNGYVVDHSEQSFIFSLTDKQKFKLIDRTGAIYRNTNKERLMFGCNEFQIGDQSNTKKTSQSEVNQRFYNSPAYSRTNKEAYLKFNGNENNTFTTKEWQVWKVEF